MANYSELNQSVIEGNEMQVKTLTQMLISQGEAPLDIIQKGLIAGMSVVGERFKEGEMFIPEVLMSARAMNSGLAIVKPLITGEDMPTIGKVVLGTVKGDLHDIGKNLVGMMMESAGFTVINLGVDVPAEKFIQAIKDNDADILGMSAMLTTTMLAMKDIIKALEKEGLRDKVKVVIGGAPVSKLYSDEIGADGYSPDASAAVELCKTLLSIDLV